MAVNSKDTEILLQRAAVGDQQCWADLITRQSDRLRRAVAFRMDHRLQGRIDASDVLQEAYVEAWGHLKEYASDPKVSFYLWLRGIAGNKLRELHRHHLGTKMRDAGREVSIYRGFMPEATSAALAAQLLGHGTQPSEAAMRAEIKVRLQEALNRMEPLDREVLALRHFEQMGPQEAAEVLGIKEKAGAMRYIRALRRLKEILAKLPDGPWGEPA